MIVAIGAGVGLSVRALINAAPPEGRVPLPASVVEVGRAWGMPIELPARLPACLAYAPGGANVETAVDATGGRELRIQFATSEQARCLPRLTDPHLVLVEAPALDSLSGAVTTLAANRLEFAAVTAPASGGRSSLLLQWRCGNQMCRLSGLTGAGTLAERDVLAMAASFRPAAGSP